MQPQNIRFGGGAAETMLSPQVALLMLIAIVLIFVVPRRNAIIPFLLFCLSIPLGEVVVLGSLHFPVVRILILAGLARMAVTPGSSSEGRFAGGFNPLDRMVVLWTVSALTTISLQWMESQALIHSVGDFIDALGGYLVVRFLIPDGESMRRAMKVLAALCVIEGCFMINEQISHMNLLGYLEGVGFAVSVRNGHIRSSGTMGCLYGGVLAGQLVPLFFWLWTKENDRIAAYAGIAGATAMVVTSHESTPLLALAAGLLGLGLWPLRKRMRLIRWGIVCTLVGLQMVMKAPVWALIARVDLTGSSSGYHRYMLVDNCIRHFGDWCLLGYRYYDLWGWDMWDLCNQFVAVALTGGLLTLVAYIAIFKRSFAAVGTARKRVDGDHKREWLPWCLGASLFSVVAAHFGTNYPGQGLLGFYPLLAGVSVVAFQAGQVPVQTIEAPSMSEVALVPASVPAEADREEAGVEAWHDLLENSVPS
jgi:hypothetical protein